MYAFELSTASPCRSAPYYSMVIRNPYILGFHAGADITLAYEGISAEHLSFTVLHAAEAAREMAAARRAAAAAERGDGEMVLDYDEEENNAVAADSNKLVVRVTALPTKGESEVRIGDVQLEAGDSAIAEDGDVLYLGEGVCGTFRYRPLMVGIESGAYPEDYVSDLRRMFGQLGATLVEEPMPAQEAPATPVGQLYCVAELNDSTSCLAALSYGYSIVQSTYVFEWFAAVAKNAAAPLSTLPAPSRFEVPVRCTTRATSTTYLRPESDTCPFSLFPIPSTAMTNRSRAELFANRVFFFFTDAAATRYWRAVEDCGGAVYGPGDIEAAREAIHMLVEAQREAGMPSDRLPNNFYIVIDNTSEAVLLNSGLEAASPELLAFMEEACANSGASHLPVMGDHTLFTALLTNKFYEEAVPLEPAAPNGLYDPADAFQVPPLSIAPDAMAADSAPAPISTRGGASSAAGYASARGAPTTARSMSRAAERRASLLPRSSARTPSRSQMRSFSRQRARSISAQPPAGQGRDVSPFDSSDYRAAFSASLTSGRHGRRRLVPSVVEGEMRSFAEDFDVLRVRIYAFLVREEPKLDKAITTYHRNLFLDTDTMEYALEVKAQAVDFMERADDLLADPACQGAYTESLRRFWRDCSDMDAKAQHLLHGWDRSMPAALLPRRHRSRRASSAAGSRRAASSRSHTPRGAAHNGHSQPQQPQSPENGAHDAAHAAMAAVLSPAPLPRDSDGAREHRELYTSTDATRRLAEADQLEEHPLSAQELEAAMGRAAASSATTPRAPSAATRMSHRRSYSPSQTRSAVTHAMPPPVPIAQRPPWVNVWSEEEASERASQAPSSSHNQQPLQQSAGSKKKMQQLNAAEPAPTPEPVQEAAPAPPAHPTPRLRGPAALLDIATDSPKVIRARSAGRASSTSRTHRTAAALQEPEQQQQQESAAPLTYDDLGPAIEFNEEGEDSAAQIATEVAALETPKFELVEEEHEDEEGSQMRTAPAPVPEPEPAPSKKKTRTVAAKPRSPSASATKRSAAANHHNGNGSGNGAAAASSTTRRAAPASNGKANGKAAAAPAPNGSRPLRVGKAAASNGHSH